MQVTTQSVVTYTEVVPLKRLAFNQLVDFVPNVKPYQVAMAVEFETSAGGVKIALTLDAMHDESWTKMALMGWESQLDKLAKLLAG